MNKPTPEQYDSKGNAKHYDDQRLRTILKIERTWGTYEAMVHCEITAFKYRDRIGDKKDQPIELELIKIKWYDRMAMELRVKIGTSLEIKYKNHKA